MLQGWPPTVKLEEMPGRRQERRLSQARAIEIPGRSRLHVERPDPTGDGVQPATSPGADRSHLAHLRWARRIGKNGATREKRRAGARAPGSGDRFANDMGG